MTRTPYSKGPRLLDIMDTTVLDYLMGMCVCMCMYCVCIVGLCMCAVCYVTYVQGLGCGSCVFWQSIVMVVY